MLATIFVTLPFVAREVLPVMEAGGSAEVEFRLDGAVTRELHLGDRSFTPAVWALQATGDPPPARPPMRATSASRLKCTVGMKFDSANAANPTTRARFEKTMALPTRRCVARSA